MWRESIGVSIAVLLVVGCVVEEGSSRNSQSLPGGAYAHRGQGVVWVWTFEPGGSAGLLEYRGNCLVSEQVSRWKKVGQSVLLDHASKREKACGEAVGPWRALEGEATLEPRGVEGGTLTAAGVGGRQLVEFYRLPAGG